MVDSLFTPMAVRRGLVPLLVFALVAVASAAPAPRPNIILITLDTTRADRMGFLGLKGRTDAEPRRGSEQECGF